MADRVVINLRGSVVPVVDMRLKFGMAETEKTVNTCIIVMEIDLESETAVVGALADSVQEVLELEPEQIEPAPRIGTKLNTEFLVGMGKHDDNLHRPFLLPGKPAQIASAERTWAKGPSRAAR